MKFDFFSGLEGRRLEILFACLILASFVLFGATLIFAARAAQDLIPSLRP